MLDPAPLLTWSSLAVLTAAAALTDARSGRIPNALTLPPLLLAPPVAAAVAGLPAAGGALAGALACGAAPLLLHRVHACGGGDVKLLAALGALAGVRLGLELELVALSLASLYGLTRLSLRRAHLLAASVTGTRDGTRAFLGDTSVRLGPWTFVATALVFALRASGTP